MFSRRQIDSSFPTTLSKSWRMLPASLITLALPSFALAKQSAHDIDTITTGSIPSQAMLWTVEPSIILGLLIAAFVALIVAGFALARRSMRDVAQQQQKRISRSFD
jgi:hypothetical protein